jgi:Asp-tRNA(Asn)/Glu-tRNA(Gln) amidotransferase C subunit
MTKEFKIGRETFLSLAEAFGLDIEDPHMEELYRYIQNVLPSLRSIEELDLTDLEPTWPLIYLKE